MRPAAPGTLMHNDRRHMQETQIFVFPSHVTHRARQLPAFPGVERGQGQATTNTRGQTSPRSGSTLSFTSGARYQQRLAPGRLLTQWRSCFPPPTDRTGEQNSVTDECRSPLRKFYRPRKLHLHGCTCTSEAEAEVLSSQSGRIGSEKAHSSTTASFEPQPRACRRAHGSETSLPPSLPPGTPMATDRPTHRFHTYQLLLAYTIHSTCSPMRSSPTNKNDTPWNRRK